MRYNIPKEKYKLNRADYRKLALREWNYVWELKRLSPAMQDYLNALSVFLEGQVRPDVEATILELHWWHICNDGGYWFLNNTFTVCNDCGFRRTRPRPKPHA